MKKMIIAAVLFLLGNTAQAASSTTILGLSLPAYGSYRWDIPMNANSNIIDSSVAVKASSQTFSGINIFTSTSNIYHGDGSALSGIITSTASLVLKAGDTMTGQLTVLSSITASGNPVSASRYDISGVGFVKTLPGDYNVSVGLQSGNDRIGGDHNTNMGHQAGYQGTTGGNNTMVGSLSGAYITTGSSNTFIGSFASVDASQKVDAVNSMALGANAYTTADNQVVLGDISITQTILRGAVQASSVTMTGSLTVQTTAFIGINASAADFPNAALIASKGNSGHTYNNNIGIVGESAAALGFPSIGVGGVASTNIVFPAYGVAGRAVVSNSADAGGAIGVEGLSEGTHAGGSNTAFWASAYGGALNYSFYGNAGNLYNNGYGVFASSVTAGGGGFYGPGGVFTGALTLSSTTISPSSVTLLGALAVANGKVGVGIASPLSTLHLGPAAGASVLKMTNVGSGHTATDGFFINNATDNNIYLGTYENARMGLYTQNTERIGISGAGVVDFTGNVGINTTAPEGTLEVKSSASPTDYVFVVTSQTATTEMLSVLGSGFVGIGATKPTVQLDISSDTYQGVDYGTEGAWGMGLRMSAGRLTFGTAASGTAIINTSGARDIGLGYYSGSSKEVIRIVGKAGANQGFVGIGETAPENKLHISSGTITMAGSGTPTKSAALCLTAAGKLSTCSTVVAADGTCTCTP